MKIQNRFVALPALLGIAVVIAGCGGGGGASYEAPPPVPQAANFTNWSKQEVFAKSETSLPTDTEGVVFNFDGDSDLNAYVELLPMTP